MSLITAFLTYLKKEKHYSEHTLKAYNKDLADFEIFIKDTGQSITTVTNKHLRLWVSGLTGQNLSDKTINRKIAALKSFYKFLLKTGSIPTNPAAQLNSLKIHRKIPVPFSTDEMENLLDLNMFSEDFEGQRDKAVIALFYSTGIRRAELINIRLQDIDFHKKELKVLGKRNKERLIPLLDYTIDTINDYITAKKEYFKNTPTEAYLFVTKKGKKMYEVLVYRLINSYISKVSVKHKKSPHMLRHTFATHLLNNGANLNAIKELLGHSSLAATQVYTHSSIQQLKNVYNKAHPRSKK